jgi:hypothetical protein
MDRERTLGFPRPRLPRVWLWRLMLAVAVAIGVLVGLLIL